MGLNKYDDFSLFNFENLLKAHKSCRKGKLWKTSAAAYDLNVYDYTLRLERMLQTGAYSISEYHAFTINERGKTRNIKSVRYKDRVVQKLLNDEILAPVILPKLIYENGASRKGKGTDFQLKLLKRHMQEHFHKYGTTGYILVGDFRHYFDSLNHEMLNGIYAQYFSDERILALIRHIHASIPGGVGVPLGNQLSQLDALLAVSGIDHYVKEKLHIRGYGRYMDDSTSYMRIRNI